MSAADTDSQKGAAQLAVPSGGVEASSNEITEKAVTESDSDVDIILNARRSGVREGGDSVESSPDSRRKLPNNHQRGKQESNNKKSRKEYVIPEGMDPEYWRTYMLPGSDEEDFDQDEEALYSGLVYENQDGEQPEFLEPWVIEQRAKQSISGQGRTHFCQFCNVAVPLGAGIQEHLRSYEHIAITRQQFGLFCQLCPHLNFPHFKSLRKHIAKHPPVAMDGEYGGGPGFIPTGAPMPFGVPLLTSSAQITPGMVVPPPHPGFGAPFRVPESVAPAMPQSPPLLQQQLDDDTQKGHRCDPCNITLPQGTKMRRHLKEPSHIQNVQATNCFCPLCPGVTFTVFKTLERHRQKHANEKKIVVVDESPLVPLDSGPGHRCDACFGIIPKGAKVKNHKMSVVHQTNAARLGLFCGLCPGKHFLTWSQLQKHKTEVHLGPGMSWKGEHYL